FLPLCEEADLVAVLDAFPDLYRNAYLKNIRAKLGLQTERKEDEELITDMFNVLQGRRVDFTLFFRHLSETGNIHGAP
ncbi:protein adenylyltransferase SelO family protein, partial [Neisseria sp. P0015.S009]